MQIPEVGCKIQKGCVAPERHVAKNPHLFGYLENAVDPEASLVQAEVHGVHRGQKCTSSKSGSKASSEVSAYLIFTLGQTRHRIRL